MNRKLNETFLTVRPDRIAILVFSLFCCVCPGHGEVFYLNQDSLTGFNGNHARKLQSARPAANDRVIRLFDWKPSAATNRFLVSKQRDSRYVPGSDAPSGFDVWLRTESGAERMIHASVFRAKFSPDGSGLAYTTTACQLRVENLDGCKLVDVERAYNPSWRRDGRVIVFEKIPEGRNPHLPETLHLATVDVASGKVELLTDGNFDDVRPEFHPSGKWILFVSGGRTGLASFWKLAAAGGKPAQLTNLGARRVDDKFVPTPYQTTTWSADGQWFLYDFKSGDVQQVWGLQFEASGNLKRALKLADGLTPQWLADGKSFVYLKQGDDGSEPVVQTIP